ncbi:MAG: LytTR family DNA-binding domain-containing protein [Pseudomonadota bacterium]|nr:LytTR family DNA-binding domain-containing protein [Pseudomonadota bacterium]
MLAIRTADLTPRLLLDKEIGLSCVGWGVFLTCAALYCIVYNQLVLISPTTFLSSFIWGLKEYAPWLVITPLLTAQLRRIHQHRGSRFTFLYAGLMITTLSAALISRAFLDILLNPQRDFVASTVDFFPGQLSVLGFIVIIWELLLRPTKHSIEHPDSQKTSTQAADRPIPSTPTETPTTRQEDSILVIKGNGERLIKWDSVDFISAAGNYMELTCGNEKYLLRVSMKQLEQSLPAGCFIRIHRSHIVNIAAIDRIIAQPAGNGAVALRNAHLLPLSKGYKQALNAYKFVTHSSPGHH